MPNAFVRSVASSEDQCDDHAHAGGATPEVARATARGEYRQVVIASSRAFCVRVTAQSADSTRSATSTFAGARFRARAMIPDSSRIDLVVR